MRANTENSVLAPSEGPPFAISNPEGKSPVLLVCEHASNTIPASLDNLGLDNATALSHVAWDPGAFELARALSALLDATLIHARFSRLAYDCNRPPTAAGAMPATSEVFDIPGNADLSQALRDRRTHEIYEPFSKALSDEIAARTANGIPTILVTIHSFTPVYFGKQRSVELGILHDVDTRLADLMLAARNKTTLDTRRNAPYGMNDGVTHTLQRHAIANGLPNVMIEVRNDMLATSDKIRNVAGELAEILADAIRLLPMNETEHPHA